MPASLRSAPTCVRKRSRAWESTQTLSQSIGSYYVRGAQQIGSSTRISGGLFDANYTTFGNSLNWRLGLSQDIGTTSVARFSVGTGFRPPLLAELLFFPPVLVDGKLQPNPAAGPVDSNCVAPNGNPNENPEHATEYELGFSHLFSSTSNLDVSIYRSNLRDTIENYYPGGGAETFCNSKLGFAYEIPINIGNAVYEGAEARYKQRFPRQNLTMTLSYGLNVAYPYALGTVGLEPDVGRHAGRQPAVSRRSAAAGFGGLYLGAARLACLDGVYVRGQ